MKIRAKTVFRGVRRAGQEVLEDRETDWIAGHAGRITSAPVKKSVMDAGAALQNIRGVQGERPAGTCHASVSGGYMSVPPQAGAGIYSPEGNDSDHISA